MKSLCWKTYLLLTNQSGTNNERKKRQNNSPQRVYSVAGSHRYYY